MLLTRKPIKRMTQAEIARRKLVDAKAEIDKLSDPVPEPARRPLQGLVVLVAVGLVLYSLRKLLAGDSDVPDPDVTPTAPMGPTDDRLNDPALKAKVESEIFAADDAPKGEVSVGVSDGIVTLRGTLASADQTSELTRAASRIDGVRRVENLIAVNGAKA